ncbi:MAG: AAA family ATPase [Treponemataceae bacterium]
MTKKSLKEYCDEIDVSEGWLNNYKRFVPQFITEATTKNNWEEWNKEVFEEFFERSGGQCVSSLGQGHFTNKEKEDIKSNWDQIAPLLKTIAENQETPNWDAYRELKEKIREYTVQNKKAATNRLVASLQPNLMNTVIREKTLSNLIKKINACTTSNIPIQGDWFEKSYAVCKVFQQELQPKDPKDIITFPWQLWEHFKKKNLIQNRKQEEMDKFIKVVKENKNLVLTGAPGTGKTYLAKQITRQIIELPDSDDLENSSQFGFVQFHPSYDYTDFVEGLRPTKQGDEKEIGFHLKNGVFKSFCEEAKDNLEDNYVFVIDEINRGEISKIFGELFFSIDPSYRGEKGSVKTQYSNMHTDQAETFYVPENVYIIGTMNDIDRSVESFDFAMRRRFTWIEITAEESAENMNLSKELKDVLANLNNEISKQEELNSSYHIGGAYFLDSNGKERAKTEYEDIWDFRLEPLLKEYLRGALDSDRKLEDLKATYAEIYN